MFSLKTIFVKYYPFCFFIKEEHQVYPWHLIKSKVNLIWKLTILFLIVVLFVLKLIPNLETTRIEEFKILNDKIIYSDWNKNIIQSPEEILIYWLKLFVPIKLLFIFTYLSFKNKEDKFLSKYFPLLIFVILEIIFFIVIFSKNFYIQNVFLKSFDKKSFEKKFNDYLDIFHFFFLFLGVIIFWIINTEYRVGIIKRIKENPESFIVFSLIICLLLLYLNRDFFFPSSSEGTEQLEERISQNEKNIKSSLTNEWKIIRWLMFFKIILIAPLWEEIFFRYFILLLVGRENLLLFLLFSIFIFSIAHMQSSEFVFLQEIEGDKSKLKFWMEKLFQPKFQSYWYMANYFALLFFTTGGNLIYNYFFHYSSNFFIFMGAGYFEKLLS